MADSNVTKNALADALKKLMQEQGFEKISVSEICEACGMNRKSFYYHFKDKYDLVNWIFYEDFLKQLQAASYDTGWDALEDLCGKFYKDRDFYLAALKIEGQNSFTDYVIETVRPLVIYFTEGIFNGSSEKEFFYIFFADAFLHAIMKWLQDNMEMTPKAFVDNLKSIFVDLALKSNPSDNMAELSSLKP